MVKCVVAPIKLLSEVGLEASETIKLSRDLPTRSIIYNSIEAFLDGIAKGKYPNPRILWLVGEWGEGKTAIYRGLIEPRDDIVSFYIVSSKVFDYIKYYENLFSNKRVWRPYIFLASIIHALIDNIDNEKVKTNILMRIHSENIEDGLQLSLIILKKYLDNKYGENKPLLLFLDEFEDIITKSESEENEFLFHIVFESLVEIVNNTIDILKKVFNNKFNIVIAITRNAEYVIETHTTIANIWGRLKRRIIRIEMRPLLQIETIELARRLINYIWENLDLKLSFEYIAEPACLMNFLAFSSMGLPASIEHIINQLVSILLVRGKRNCEGQLEKLTIENVIDVLKGLTTVVYGSEEKVFMYENYVVEKNKYVNDLKEIIGDKPYLHQLIDLILLSITGLDLEKDLYKITKSKIEIEAIISFLEYHGIGYKAKKYKVLTTKLDKFINEYIIRHLNEVLNKNEVYYRNLLRVFGEETLRSIIDLYSELLDKLIYISSNSNVIIVLPEKLEKFFEKHLDIEPAQSLYIARYVNEVIEKLIDNGVITEDGETILLSPTTITKIFFSQEIAVLDFIDKKELRPTIWKEARSTRSEEPFLIGALVPLLDILKGYFSGFKKLDHEELIIKTNQIEPITYAEIKITACNEKGYPIKYKITELKTEYIPTLKAHIVPISGATDPEALIKYIRKLEQTNPLSRPHIVIFLHAGILHSSSLNEYKQMLKSLNIAMISIPFKVIDYFKLTALGLYYKNIVSLDNIETKEDYALKLVELVEGKLKLKGINDFVLRAYIRSQLETTDTLRNLINNIDKELKELGILIPHPRRSLKINNIELGTPDLYKASDSLKWIIHYDKPLKNVSVKDIFTYTLNKVQRYTIFGRRYKLVIGLDIENPDTFARYLGPLTDLGIIKLEHSSNKISGNNPSELLLTLVLDESSYFRRLYYIYNTLRQEIITKNLLNAFVVKDTPDETLDIFFKALKSIGVIHIDKSKIIKLQTDNEVLINNCSHLYDKLNKYIEAIGNDEETYGYIVSGKKRHQPPWNPGYRYGKTSELRHYIENKLDKICKEIASANELSVLIDISRRMASTNRIISEILGFPGLKSGKKKSEEKLKTHYEIIIESKKEVNYIKKNILLSCKEKLEELTGGLKNLLIEKIFSNNVIIKSSLIDVLNESIMNIDNIINTTYEEETLGELVNKLWIRFSAEEFPFNFKGSGIGYLFNFKIYEIVENVLKQTGILEIDPTKTKRSEKYQIKKEFNELLSRLEELRKRIKTDLELITELGKNYNSIKSKISESPILNELFGKNTLPKIFPENIVALVKITSERNIYDLTSLEDLVLLESEIEKWEYKVFGEQQDINHLNEKLHKLKYLLNSINNQYLKLRSLIDDLEEFHKSLSELTSDLDKLIEHNILHPDKLKEIKEKYLDPKYSVTLEKIINEIRDECLRKNKLYSTNMRLDLDQIIDLFKCINNELKKQFESLNEILNDIYKSFKRTISEINDFYKVKYIQFENIRKILDKIMEKTQYDKDIYNGIMGLVEEIKMTLRNISDMQSKIKMLLSSSTDTIRSYKITECLNILKESIKSIWHIINRDPSKFKIELLRNLMKMGLSNEELNILKAIIEYYSTGASEIISLRKLIEICSKKYGINRENVMKGLLGLIEKEIISAEIRF